MDFSRKKTKDLIELYNGVNTFIKFLDKEYKDSEKMLEDDKK